MPTRLNYLVQECWIFPCVRYHPETQTVAWTWDNALDFCLSQNVLYVSLSSSTSTSFTLSQILLPQSYLWWSWVTYLSQDSNPSLCPIFPSVFLSPIKYTSGNQEKTPFFCIEILQLGHPITDNPLSALPWHLVSTDHLISTLVSIFPYLTQGSKHFQTRSPKGSSNY